MTSLILSVKFDQEKAIITLNMPDHLFQDSLASMPDPEKTFVSNMAAATDWLKMAARKNSLHFELWCNGKKKVDSKEPIGQDFN